jgi:protein-S-isoprenylcysteine O-methyltransferase Ste14
MTGISAQQSMLVCESADWRMSMAVEPDSAGVRFPPPFLYLGALLLGLAAERYLTLRSFGVDWRLLVATGALLFIAGATMMLAAAGLFRRLGTRIPPSRPATVIATTGPYRWTRNPMYLGMALIYAALAIGLDGPIALALLPFVLIVIQTQVIAREERYLEAKFGDDYRRYKAEVRRWL